MVIGTQARKDASNPESTSTMLDIIGVRKGEPCGRCKATNYAV
jgi:hypothetical protein